MVKLPRNSPGGTGTPPFEKVETRRPQNAVQFRLTRRSELACRVRTWHSPGEVLHGRKSAHRPAVCAVFSCDVRPPIYDIGRMVRDDCRNRDRRCYGVLRLLGLELLVDHADLAADRHNRRR